MPHTRIGGRWFGTYDDEKCDDRSALESQNDDPTPGQGAKFSHVVGCHCARCEREDHEEAAQRGVA